MLSSNTHPEGLKVILILTCVHHKQEDSWSYARALERKQNTIGCQMKAEGCGSVSHYIILTCSWYSIVEKLEMSSAGWLVSDIPA